MDQVLEQIAQEVLRRGLLSENELLLHMMEHDISPDLFESVRNVVVRRHPGRIRKAERPSALAILDSPAPNAVEESQTVAPSPSQSVDHLVHEIGQVVIDRGRLKKREILLQFNVPSADYDQLCRSVLEAFPSKISRAPRGAGGGGLISRYSRRGRPPRGPIRPLEFLLEPWEQRVVDWFGRMQRKQIENLLGQTKNTLRRLIEVKTGQDRRGEKHELATALVLQHGRDTLARKDIRQAVAKAAGVDCPASWHAGKSAAMRFVRECELPEELAGILSPERQPSIERLEGREALPPLQPFQEELKAEIRNRLLYGGPCRAIATLPTGAGKTRVAVEVLRDTWAEATGSHSVVWLAHTEELCEQAFQCVKEVWEATSRATPITAIRYWGRYCANDARQAEAEDAVRGGHALIVSTPQRLKNVLLDDERQELAHELIRQTRILVIDEAHRAGAPTYGQIADRFREANGDVAMLGLTATPYRTEYFSGDAGVAELRRVFDDLIEASRLGDQPRAWLQREGILAQLDLRESDTEITVGAFPESIEGDLRELSLETQGQADQQLQSLADRHERRLTILKYVLDACQVEGSSILYFGPTVQDAQAMTFLLRSEKIRAAFVSGETRTAVRRRLIADFKAGKIQVLCNCEVLTTGFDAPRVTHLMIARPTVSQVLWEQMLGRGLRGPKFGGTETCVVYDFVDNFSGNRGKIRGFLDYRAAWRATWLD